MPIHRFCIAKDYGKWRVYDDFRKVFAEPVDAASSKPLARSRAAVMNRDDPPSKFRVYFINHDYYAQDDFNDSESALAHGKKACFEFVVYEFRGKDCIRRICSWSPIGGTKYFV